MAMYTNKDGGVTVILNTKYPCCGVKARVLKWGKEALTQGIITVRMCPSCRTKFRTQINPAHPHTQEIMGEWEAKRVDWVKMT